MVQNLVLCSACRAYGVPLIDGRCEMCYTLNYPAREGLQPGHLPYALGASDDKHTTRTHITQQEYENWLYIRQRYRRREKSKQIQKERHK